jgi:hypothetical protein
MSDTDPSIEEVEEASAVWMTEAYGPMPPPAQVLDPDPAAPPVTP